MSIDDLFKKISTSASPVGKPEYLIVGLGNPGREYAETRHNAGFLAIDALAARCGVRIDRAKYDSLCAETTLGGCPVLLMKPQTYMNLSGTAVSQAAKFYKIPAERILVLCDDITQKPGKIRIRKSGSAGGHNGLKSIIGWVGGDKFPRIRIGVGEKPTPEYDLADWVTGKLSEEDKKAISARFADISAAAELVLKGDFERAMCLYNG
ncbi:MAG: aminoacyl-tRNA hydrolase [Clostridia bacterium]|nr:aminoacyl-tRNA hydrolase [Clostridia bacterium]